MVKRIILTSLICTLAFGSFACYFFFAGNYADIRKRECKCRKAEVTILDSLASSAVNKREILDILEQNSLGRNLASLNVKAIEEKVMENGEVVSAEVYATNYNKVAVRLTQRRPVARFKCGAKSFYCDSTGYLFPAKHYLETPIITGCVPMPEDEHFKGFMGQEQAAVIKNLSRLASFIESDNFLKKQIQQIEVAENGEITLYPAIGRQTVLFGQCDSFAGKFRKLEAYYRNIAPTKGNDAYSTVNLKYKNQIICR